MDNGDLEPEEDDEEEVFIMHSCQNERKNHMVTKSQPQSLKFPISFKPAIEKVCFTLPYRVVVTIKKFFKMYS